MEGTKCCRMSAVSVSSMLIWCRMNVCLAVCRELVEPEDAYMRTSLIDTLPRMADRTLRILCARKFFGSRALGRSPSQRLETISSIDIALVALVAQEVCLRGGGTRNDGEIEEEAWWEKARRAKSWTSRMRSCTPARQAPTRRDSYVPPQSPAHCVH